MGNKIILKAVAAGFICLLLLACSKSKKTSGSATNIAPVTTQTTTPVPEKVDFTYYGDTLAGHSTTFMSESTRGSLFMWNFGDGHDTAVTLMQSGVTHYYAASGTYTVTYTIDGDTSRSVRRVLTIKPNYIFLPYGLLVEKDSIHFTFRAILPHGDVFLWNFGDGTTSTDTTPYHVFQSGGTYNVSLQIVNRHITQTRPIHISKTPANTPFMLGSHPWTGHQIIVTRADSPSSPATYMRPDTVFSIDYIDKLTVKIGFLNFNFDESRSDNSNVYFTENMWGGYLYYNVAADSMGFRGVIETGGPTPGGYTVVKTIEDYCHWHK